MLDGFVYPFYGYSTIKRGFLHFQNTPQSCFTCFFILVQITLLDSMDSACVLKLSHKSFHYNSWALQSIVKHGKCIGSQPDVNHTTDSSWTIRSLHIRLRSPAGKPLSNLYFWYFVVLLYILLHRLGKLAQKRCQCIIIERNVRDMKIGWADGVQILLNYPIRALDQISNKIGIRYTPIETGMYLYSTI